MEVVGGSSYYGVAVRITRQRCDQCYIECDNSNSFGYSKSNGTKIEFFLCKQCEIEWFKGKSVSFLEWESGL
jgi:hypothetical protein